MWTLKFITYDFLTHIKTSFSYRMYLKMVKKSSFFKVCSQVKNIVAEIFHGDNTTVESQRLNCIQESEYTSQIYFYFICILCFVIF